MGAGHGQRKDERMDRGDDPEAALFDRLADLEEVARIAQASIDYLDAKGHPTSSVLREKLKALGFGA